MIASGAAISDPQETNFKGIEAPGLTSVGEADSTAFDSILSQIDNPDNVQFNFTPGFSLQTFPSLNQMGFPSLSSVGGNFLVAQNPDLGDINLPLLSTIGGNLDVTGDFNSLELLISITLVEVLTFKALLQPLNAQFQNSEQMGTFMETVLFVLETFITPCLGLLEPM